jgi:hypothetical protein
MNSLLQRYEKYKYEKRLVFVFGSSKKKDFREAMKIYQNSKKELCRLFVKVIFVVNRKKFRVYLVGFDGEIKNEYDSFNVENIKEEIQKMPMGNLINGYC